GLANADFRGGLVHHITSSDSPSVESLLAIVGKECGAGPIGVLRERSEQASPVEQLMDRRATFYASYLRAPKTFARRAGAGVSVSNEDLTRFVRAFVRLSRKETADAVFDRELVRSPHSPALVSYAVGDADKPALVLCNAYGIPADVWVPLASALKREYRILTWELRAHDGEDCGPDLHATDLKRVLNHHGITSCYVAGFCTGADVALRFAELYPRRALGVISVAGALNMMHGPETTFQRDMRKLAKSAAHDLARAQLYHQLLFGQRHDELGAQTEGARSTEAWLGSMVGELDPSVLHLTSAPFRDADTLHDYAKTMHDHYAHSERTSLSRLELPALFITGTRDTVSHPEPSRLAAAQMADATLLELNEADHFAVYSETAVMGAVRDFINRVERGLAREPAYLMACAS
ncbi:MAG: Male sterility-like protein, partial [Myxococcaceae bacterium]|nr:Male sterility-like protein [Myxococcaceae bacterium]